LSWDPIPIQLNPVYFSKLFSPLLVHLPYVLTAIFHRPFCVSQCDILVSPILSFSCTDYYIRRNQEVDETLQYASLSSTLIGLCLVGKSSYLLSWSHVSLIPLLLAEWQTTFYTHKLHKPKEFITYYFMPSYSVASECGPAFFLFSCVHLESKLTKFQ
jgi:hypothetical protein